MNKKKKIVLSLFILGFFTILALGCASSESSSGTRMQDLQGVEKSGDNGIGGGVVLPNLEQDQMPETKKPDVL